MPPKIKRPLEVYPEVASCWLNAGISVKGKSPKHTKQPYFFVSKNLNKSQEVFKQGTLSERKVRYKGARVKPWRLWDPPTGLEHITGTIYFLLLFPCAEDTFTSGLLEGLLITDSNLNTFPKTLRFEAHGVSSSRTTGHGDRTRNPPALPTHPLQPFDLILFELEDCQCLLMFQFQLLSSLGDLSHMLQNTQEDTSASKVDTR